MAWMTVRVLAIDLRRSWLEKEMKMLVAALPLECVR